jgi:hypothetical protein
LAKRACCAADFSATFRNAAAGGYEIIVLVIELAKISKNGEQWFDLSSMIYDDFCLPFTNMGIHSSMYFMGN